MCPSKNRPCSSNATKLPANDSASFPFRFINVHSEAVSDRQRDQFFEVPSSYIERALYLIGSLVAIVFSFVCFTKGLDFGGNFGGTLIVLGVLPFGGSAKA